MSHPALLSNGALFSNKVCVLVTAAFARTLVPGFSQPERSLLSRREIKERPLLVFMVLGLVEKNRCFNAGWLNERIVAVSVSILLSRSFGRTGYRSVCHLVGGRAPRTAVRLDRNFHVVRWSGRRLAEPMARTKTDAH